MADESAFFYRVAIVKIISCASALDCEETFGKAWLEILLSAS